MESLESDRMQLAVDDHATASDELIDALRKAIISSTEALGCENDPEQKGKHK